MNHYLAIIAIVVILIEFYFERPENDQISIESYLSIGPDCLHLYFDFSTNVGIEIRKLFEPELYPGSEIIPIFDSYFGNAFERRIPGAVCAIGVEPNIAHEERLKRLESSYNNHSW